MLLRYYMIFLNQRKFLEFLKKNNPTIGFDLNLWKHYFQSIDTLFWVIRSVFFLKKIPQTSLHPSYSVAACGVKSLPINPFKMLRRSHRSDKILKNLTRKQNIRPLIFDLNIQCIILAGQINHLEKHHKPPSLLAHVWHAPFFSLCFVYLLNNSNLIIYMGKKKTQMDPSITYIPLDI